MTPLPTFWARLPAEIRYHPRLCPGAKLLWAEAAALQEVGGECYATDAYFARVFGAGLRTVQRWIASLSAAGVMEITTESGRRIISCSGVSPKMAGGIAKNGERVSPKMAGGYRQKCHTDHDRENKTEIPGWDLSLLSLPPGGMARLRADLGEA